jgi:hypothetical protein
MILPMYSLELSLLILSRPQGTHPKIKLKIVPKKDANNDEV